MSEFDQSPEARSLYYVIPSEIMDCDMPDKYKLCYALLSGYAAKSGKCFPSDDHLGSRLGISGDRAGRIVSALEKKGLISKITIPHPKQPFHKIRIITVEINFKKPLSTGKNNGFEKGENNGSEPGENNGIVSEGNSKEKDSSLRSEKKKSTASPRPPKKYIDLLKYPKVTKLTMEGYERLIKRHGKGLIEKNLYALNEYAKMKEKKFKEYSDHEAVINNWIKSDLPKEKSSTKMSAEELEKQNKIDEERRRKWRKQKHSKDS